MNLKQDDNLAGETARPVWRAVLPGIFAVMLVSVGGAMLGTPLGLAMWALVVCVILVAACEHEHGLRSAVDVGSVATGAGLVVLGLPVVFAEVSWANSALSGLVVWCFALGVAGVVRGLMIAGVGASVARASVARVSVARAMGVVIAVVWLGWPIFLAKVLVGEGSEGVVDWLVKLHPPMVLNMLLEPGDPWSHRPTAYGQMRLGQDVSYAMPTTAAWCVLLHLSLSAAVWFNVIRGAMTWVAKRGKSAPM